MKIDRAQLSFESEKRRRIHRRGPQRVNRFQPDAPDQALELAMQAEAGVHESHRRVATREERHAGRVHLAQVN